MGTPQGRNISPLLSNIMLNELDKVIRLLYDEPITSRKKIIEATGIKFTTLVGVIKVFQEKGILIETTGYSRNQVFSFQRYIDLFLK